MTASASAGAMMFTAATDAPPRNPARTLRRETLSLCARRDRTPDIAGAGQNAWTVARPERKTTEARIASLDGVPLDEGDANTS